MQALACKIVEIMRREGVEFKAIFLVGFMKYVMKHFQELADTSSGDRTDAELRIIPKFVEDAEAIQKCVEEGVLPKTVLVAPPGLNYMLPRVKRLYQIFTAMCKKAGIPMILCGMTLQLYTRLRKNVTGIPAPASWRFFAEVAMCLSFVGISPNIQLTMCDSMAFDLYDVFVHMIESLGMSPTTKDGPAFCGPRGDRKSRRIRYLV